MSEFKTLKVDPPLWFLAALAITALLGWLTPAQPGSLHYPWSLVGLLVCALGIGLAVSGERAFKKAGTAVKPFVKSSALVESGPYRFTRNPMYLGMLLTLAGLWALAGGGFFSAIPAVMLFGCFNRIIDREERMMRALFGERWSAYRQKTRRWL